MGQSAGVVHKTEEETERCMMRSDRLWLWVAVIGGLIGGVLMRHQDHTVHYHYEDHVEITDGFYAGRSGTVSTCWADLFGYRSYNVRLDTGELVFSIAEEDLKLHPDQGSRR